MEHDPRPTEASRRAVIRGGAAAGFALPLLAACGPGSSAPTGAADLQAPTGKKPLLSTSQVPVGGGKILADEQLVVTQPDKGDFKGFSAVCTHQQCLVTKIQDGVIICPCHGSEFSIKNGSVVRGPAAVALPALKIRVENGEVLPG